MDGLFLLVLLAGFCLFLPSLRYDFVFDDHQLVTGNPAVKEIKWAARDLVKIGYRPVRTLSYSLDYLVAGFSPWFFHLSNLLWHLLVMGMAWLVLKEIVEDRWVARVAMLLFAVHPVHIDAVAYVSGRRDLLSAFFTLLALYAYIRFYRDRRVRWWPLILVASALAFLSKEMGIVIPLLIFLYDWSRRVADTPTDGRWKALKAVGAALRQGWWYYGLLAVGGLFFVWKVLSGTYTGRVGWWGGTVVTNALTSAKLLCNDVFLMLFPFRLRADYSYDAFPVARTPFDLLGWLAVLAVIVLVWQAWRVLAGGRFTPGFWGLWFLVSLLPVLHLVPHHELFAEHYLYLPSIGLCVAAAWYLRKAARRAPGWAGALVCGVTVAFTIATLAHMGVYADEESLRLDVLSKAPACVRANLAMGDRHFNEGKKLFEENNPWGARQAFEKAAEFYERIAAVPPEYVLEGLPPEKIARLRNLGTESGYERVHREVMYHARAFINLGNIRESLGDRVKARENYLRALDLGSQTDLIYNRLGSLTAEEGKLEEALDWFRKAMALKPNNPDLLTNMGVAFCGLKQWAQARRYLERAVAVDPGYALAHYYFAMVLVQTGETPGRAIYHLRRALDLKLDPRVAPDARKLLETLRGKAPKPAPAATPGPLATPAPPPPSAR
ncbi:MAG: tetratricopeptide repeat protein [Acidobacteria bacterium]|nr:tetratricopeptide repeat protein [Acidobacteriota bacterium]